MPTAAGLYYAHSEGGASNNKPVVLIHGAGSSHLCWPANLRRLSGRTVLALDLPGHGRSAGIGLQSVEAYCAAIVAFLAEIGLYQAVFVGHSLGGAIALQLALDFPQHTSGLGLISSGACMNVDADLLHYLSNASTFEVGLQFLQKHLFSTTTASSLIKRSMSFLCGTRPSVLYNDWTACSKFDLSKIVAQIDSPAYIACGLEDGLTPPSMSRFLAASLPNARLDLLPDAGHMLIIEQPQALAKGLASFLADLDAYHEKISLPLSIQKEEHESRRLDGNQQEV